MVRALTPRLAIGLLFTSSANGFVPFAGVEELKPQRLHDFCSKEALPGQDGVRECSHAFKKRLSDGGDVELGWKMNADPDSILSLDTEAEAGCRLSSCKPGELELELPESHAHHAAAGKLIVASRFVHSCEHLVGEHMYHRVVGVKRHEWRQGSDGARTAHVHLVTEELPSVAHAVPYLSFHFSYTPAEARDLRPFPRMRTDYGLNRNFRNNPRQRRLSLLPKYLSDKLDTFKKKANGVKGFDGETGGFQSGGTSSGVPTIKTESPILNLVPKQVSNFGWNWNFRMNTTQEPNINISGPGAKGVFMLRKPYINVHAGIYLNFTSDFNGITKLQAPKVRWTAGVHGHGYVQARIKTFLNTTSAAGLDPFAFKRLGLGKIEKLKTPLWFEKVDFASPLPFSFEPGFKFNAKIYHSGTFHGAIMVGGRTHGQINTSLTFDSLKGAETHFQGTLINTDVWPPLWIVFTKQFELGLMLMPSILIRGNFAGLEKATAAIDMRPYLNMTILREGSTATSSSEMKTLTVYPIRVMGIADSVFNEKYQVRINALENTLETTPEINWGEVRFHDHIQDFDCGSVPQSEVINKPITVTLIKIDAANPTGPGEEMGYGEVVCTSLLNGECNPSPGIADIKTPLGAVIATVEFAIVWQDSPDAWFASKIRGVAISFPQVVLRTDALRTTFPGAVTATSNFTQGSKPLSLHLRHGGRTYVMPVRPGSSSSSQQSDVLEAQSTIQFDPNFLETWMPCTNKAGKCESPEVSIYYGTTEVALTTIPQIQWTSQTAMQGTSSSSLLGGGDSGSSAMNVPATVALYDPNGKEAIIAVVKMNANVVSPSESSLFLSPTSAQPVGLSSTQQFTWLVSNVDVDEEYEFTLSSLKVTTVPSTTTYLNYPKVGNMALMPIPGAETKTKIKCQPIKVAGMEASEAPCSFSHAFPFGEGYKPGDQVIVLVSWQGGSTTQMLYSPPFEIVAKAPARRLFDGSAPPAEARRLKLAKWNNLVDSHSQCKAKKLKFNLGAGMLVRGKIGSVKMPKGFPMLGGLSEQPSLKSKWKKVAGMKPSTEAKDFLPESLCDAGMCSGTLPGCTGAGADFKKMHFPKLVFNFNRLFYYKHNATGKMQTMMRQVLAYAFATLPEMVNVAIKELNEPRSAKSGKGGKGNKRGGGSSYLPGGQLSGTQYPSPAPQTTTVGVFNRWWNGVETRRLEEASDDEETAWAQKPGQQVGLEFKEGVPFIVDRPLVEMMLHHNYFTDMEDDATETHGPLAITDFYVDSGADVVTEDDTEHRGISAPWWFKADAAKLKRAATAPRGWLVAVLGGTCLAAVAAVAALHWKRAARPEEAGMIAMTELYEADGME